LLVVAALAAPLPVILTQSGGGFQLPYGLVIQSLGVWLSRYGQGAAYAAGVSIGCRRSSHFSLAGPREK
jgi:hypothetical protein